MLNDPDYFKHTRSSYERPNFKYRCGREKNWRKPCSPGPNPDGSCGGIVDCAPFKKGDRYECRRPLSAGGPCEEGPRADGSCSQRRPPCVPQPTMRVIRGRWVLFTFSLTAALIGFLLIFSKSRSETWLSPVDPGPLTAKHAKFAEEHRCVSCHLVHGADKGAGLKAILTKADLTNQCLTCHAFGGPGRKAHNTILGGRDAERQDSKDTACTMCHIEHRGVSFDIKKMSDGQCNACHQVKFESFSKGHPAFPQDYPQMSRPSVQFDHVAHWNRHFKNAAVAKLAPQACTACHTVESKAQDKVKTGSFEQNCVSCHAAEIQKKELIFFRLPQLEQGMDPKLVEEACGPASVSPAPGSFESISTEEPTAIMAFLMGIDPSDAGAYTQGVQSLLLDMAQNGTAPLAALLDQRAGAGSSSKLLGSLNPEVLKRAVCAWAENLEYESETPSGFHGWFADLLELKYKPAGHADPVLQNWIDFAAGAVPQSQDAVEKTRLEAVRKDFLDRTGSAGTCTKCHAVSVAGSGEVPQRLSVDWKYRGQVSRKHTHFSHGVHMNLLGGAGDACLKCHAMNPNADYASSFKGLDASQFVSNFSPIRKEACMECHGAETKTQTGSRIRQDCLLCHTYHLEPRIVKKE